MEMLIIDSLWRYWQWLGRINYYRFHGKTAIKAHISTETAAKKCAGKCRCRKAAKRRMTVAFLGRYGHGGLPEESVWRFGRGA